MKSLIGISHDWSFESGLKDVISGILMTLKPNAVMTENRFGESSAAVYFNNTYATLPYDNYLGDEFSISLWIKPKYLNISFAGIFFTRQNNDFVLFAMADGSNPANNNLRFRFSNAGIICGESRSKKQLVLNAWTFITLTYKDMQSKIYINGLLDATAIHTCALPKIEGEFKIGNRDTDLSIDSIISDFRIFNKLISDQIVQQFYQNLIQGLY